MEIYRYKFFLLVCIGIHSVSFPGYGEKGEAIFLKEQENMNIPTNYARPLKFLYKNFWGRIAQYIAIKPFASVLAGLYCDFFVSKYHIPSFIRKFNIDINEYEKSAEEYTSFNDFFIRKLKPGVRCIDMRPNIIASPADGAVLVIDNIQPHTLFPIKNISFCLATFLGNEYLAERYYGGTMIIFRLAPPDYHRFHFPLDAVTSKPIFVKGVYHSVDPIALESIQPFHTNKRLYMTLHTPVCDDVLMVAVGALGVGRIVTTYQPYHFHTKGDEVGYFCFGGSTVVLLFKPSTIEVSPHILSNSAQGIETKIKMGQEWAKALSGEISSCTNDSSQKHNIKHRDATIVSTIF